MVSTRARLPWIPQRPVDGDSAFRPFGGRIYYVGGWGAWSDGKKLRKLRELATQQGQDPGLRVFVVDQILRPAGVEPRDYDGQAAAILHWVQEQIYYTNEPGEQIQTPGWTLKVRTGDCDDIAVLLAAMFESLRFSWRFVLAGKRPDGQPVRWIEGTRAPKGAVSYKHIYVTVGVPPFRPSRWYSLEGTVRRVPVGYDVVEHGLPPWLRDGGTSALPEMGAVVAPSGARKPLLAQIKERLDWRDLAIGVLQSVIVGVILERVLATRKRGRR